MVAFPTQVIRKKAPTEADASQLPLSSPGNFAMLLAMLG